MNISSTREGGAGPEARVPIFYSVPEAAKLIGTSSVTLYRAIRDGEFPALRVRGRLIIPARVLDEMVSTAVGQQSVVDVAAWVPSPRRSAD
ncbi:helix-turn-helix domain-containing protein [Pseudonocardia sp. C8]|uniref:helix-turn-helix domain-containing protein n=1 Tax=Pseudonocardia sp. C8 TaxID=2762759 RepID=UPI00164362D2|nr:helix-turn-helix domain-containing protein [Pseudonocardia sp. C8]MBC3189967.1 helix-turn-helix domain-containing protein [Pseudonocardia sp. C8]